jgi:hypothetical protein
VASAEESVRARSWLGEEENDAEGKKQEVER